MDMRTRGRVAGHLFARENTAQDKLKLLKVTSYHEWKPDRIAPGKIEAKMIMRNI